MNPSYKPGNIILRPIGFVVSGMPPDSRIEWNRWREVSVIEIDKELVDALKGLEEYSHIFIIYWMHLAEWREENKVMRPRGRDDLPEVGVFAFRGRTRPNPIGLSVCELVSIKDNIIEVRGLDAYPGSPVLDIKPYDYYDIVNRVKVPRWFQKLWEERRSERPLWVGP